MAGKLTFGVLTGIGIVLLVWLLIRQDESEVVLTQHAAPVRSLVPRTPESGEEQVPATAGPEARKSSARKRVTYDLETVETIRGTVSGTQGRRKRKFRGGQLGLETETGTVNVRVPLRAYMQRKDFELDMDDPVEVVGNTAKGRGGATVLMAARLKKGDRVLKLRGYNPENAQTVSGKVASFGWFAGAQMPEIVSVKTEDEEIRVVLASQDYMDRQGLRVEEGDEIQVTGSRGQGKIGPVILAAEVTKGEQRVELRDHEGKPLWRKGPPDRSGEDK